MQLILNSPDDANMQVIKTCIKSFLDQAINDVASNTSESDEYNIIKHYPAFDIISNSYINMHQLKAFKAILDEFKIVVAMDEASLYSRAFTISFTEFNGTILPYCISIAVDD